MSAPATTDALVTLVRKSGLVDPPRLDEFLAQPENAALPTDHPRKLARRLVRAALLTDFQAIQLLQGKHRGFTLGKYLLLEDLPVDGPFASFLVEDRHNQERFTVRMLPELGEAKSLALAQFYLEARVDGVEHPNLASPYEVRRDGQQYFLLTPYVDGCDLRRIVRKRGPLDVYRAAHYIRQAAGGLQLLHERGLAHLDLGPHQLLLDRQGAVKVLHYGLACFLDNSPSNEYRAPEQAAPEGGSDIRADVYSLGATFHYLVTGKLPSGEEPLGRLCPDMPAGLALVIEKMLARDPTQRYQTPAEIVEAVAAWTAKPVAAPSPEELPELSPAAQAKSFTRQPSLAIEVTAPALVGSAKSAGPVFTPLSAAMLDLMPSEPEGPDTFTITVSRQPEPTGTDIPTLSNTDTAPELPPLGAPPEEPKPIPMKVSVPSELPREEAKREPVRPTPPPPARPIPSPPSHQPSTSGSTSSKKPSGSTTKPSAKKWVPTNSTGRLGKEFWLVLLFLLVWIPVGYGLSSLFRSDEPDPASQEHLLPPTEQEGLQPPPP